MHVQLHKSQFGLLISSGYFYDAKNQYIESYLSLRN